MTCDRFSVVHIGRSTIQKGPAFVPGSAALEPEADEARARWWTGEATAGEVLQVALRHAAEMVKRMTPEARAEMVRKQAAIYAKAEMEGRAPAAAPEAPVIDSDEVKRLAARLLEADEGYSPGTMFTQAGDMLLLLLDQFEALHIEVAYLTDDRDTWKRDCEKIMAERDEADRRAGAAERHAAGLQDSAFARTQWLDKAKDQRGYPREVSFDVVWAETCAKADERDAAIASRDATLKASRATFEAMCAMRDSINEHIPMPSLESDLLQGPEDSVFCETVAEAVIGAVASNKHLRDLVGRAIFAMPAHCDDWRAEAIAATSPSPTL